MFKNHTECRTEAMHDTLYHALKGENAIESFIGYPDSMLPHKEMIQVIVTEKHSTESVPGEKNS
jgi:hypothetical protein